jgi:hypothetical protein
MEDLISANPIVDLGYRIILQDDGGWIEKDNKIIIRLRREQLRWLIDLKELKCLNASIVKKENEQQDIEELVKQLHRRMGHSSSKTMISAIESGAWSKSGVTVEQIKRVMKDYVCPICLLAKRNQTHVHKSVTDPKSVPIAGLISGDIIGPITPTARDGSKYFFLFVDRRTSYYHVFTSKTKDGFITALQHVYDWYSSHGHTIKTFRSDSENILVHGDVASYLKSNAVNQQFSLPYAHYQNLVERHVQTIVNFVVAVLHDQQLLGDSFWDYCIFYVIVIKNNTPNTKTDGQTPLQMITGKAPVDLSREFPFAFGQPVAARVPKRTWRFDLKSELGIYLGVSEGSIGGGLVYYPSTKRIAARGDLVPLNIKPEEFKKYENIGIGEKPPLCDLTFEIPAVLEDVEAEKAEDAELNIPLPETTNKPSSINQNNKIAQEDQPMKPMSRRQFKKLLNKYGVETRAMKKLLALSVKLRDGKTKGDELTQALSSEEREEWIAALTTEIQSLLNTTNSIIPETPDPQQDYDIIYATTALKKKLHPDGTIDKYKVRIPVCGNQLKAKFDYNNDTYSPTVSMITHTSLLQLSIYDKMHMATFDTVAAYLHQDYPENLKPLYLKFPKHLAKACGLNPEQLYRIKKYMYGLPDAGRAYYIAYSKALTDNGYTMSKSDPCLFLRFDETQNMRTYVWIHVDDTFVSSTHQSELKRFEEIIGSVFPITANFDVTSHLGISLTKHEDGSLSLSQSKLLQQIFDEYPSSERKSKYPAVNRNDHPVEHTDNYDTEEDRDNSKYLRLLGQLNYLTHSRPDISPAVSYAATKCQDWTESDYQDLLLIVSYLRQTSDYGLTLYPRQDDDDGTINLTAYVDAAYMSHRNASSHTGYCIAIGSKNPKSYFMSKSTKQKMVATSSTHAEVRALYDLTVNVIYLKVLFDEIKRPITLPVTIYEDNQSTIDLVTSMMTKIGKSKHYLMLTHFIKEQIQNGLMNVNKIDGDKNISNIMTKIVSSKEFFDSINRIMGLLNDDEMISSQGCVENKLQ